MNPLTFGSTTLVVVALSSPASAQFLEDCVPLHTLTGEGAGDQFGWVSERLGDIDGDGVEDYVVTAPFLGANAGRIYVTSGRTGASLFQAKGPSGSQLGFAVDRGGDLDLDGTPDVVAGAPGSGPGSVRVYSGATGGQIRQWSGSAGLDQYGYAVGLVGDVDLDGAPDYVVGARNHDASFPNAGRAYLVSGAAGTDWWTFDGEEAGDQLGGGAGGTGDLNQDGIPDVAVSAPNGGPGNRGRTYLLSGKDGTLLAPPFDADPTGTSMGLFFTSGAGDVDGDGTPDVYVGDFADSALGANTGKVYVLSGKTGTAIHTFTGAAAGEGMGPGRGNIDWDEDGLMDLVIASWTSSAAAPSGGRVQVFSGADSSLLKTVTGSIAGDTLGFDAHPISDLDGDGAADLVLTAAGNDAAGNNAGRAYAVGGGPVTLAPDPGTTGVSNAFVTKSALPGELVVLLYGLTPGTIKSPCNGPPLDLGLPVFFTIVAAGNDGDARLDAIVPASLSGVTLLMQSIELARCARSARVDYTFP